MPPLPLPLPADQPVLSGWEAERATLTPIEPPPPADWREIRAGFACALHMHQATIPVGET